MKQLILPLNLPPAFNVKDFIVSKSNEDAYLWLLKWPNWPHRCLSIYGEKGCGKSHLAKIWETNTSATLLKGQEVNEAPLEILFQRTHFFVLDEANLITQEEKVFHLYNHIVSSKGGLLLLSQTPPSQWEIKLPDLKSRLNSTPALKIHPPDEALLIQVIQKLFNDAQVIVETTVSHFLLKHIERSFESVRFWVNALNTAALAQNRRITIPLVREVMVKEGLAEIHL